tara:strand:+ start:6151 stop:6942 length:792 start_codon:yes stop_codon:yes gene_type:complete
MSETINNFNNNQNKALLWDMMLNNGIFTGIDNSKSNNVKKMFENIIITLNRDIIDNVSNQQLLELNKQVIIQVKNNIAIFKQTNNVKTIDNEKILIFDKNLESAKSDFDKSITPKIPDQPEFKLQEDTPLGTKNMNEMLEKLQRDRELLIPPPPPSPTHNSGEKSNIESDLLDLSNKNVHPLKKINNIEDLFKVSNLQNEPNKSDKLKSEKHVKFDSLQSILKHEYKSENKMNQSIKITRVFELLTEINNKQDQIINLLQSEH